MSTCNICNKDLAYESIACICDMNTGINVCMNCSKRYLDRILDYEDICSQLHKSIDLV